MVTNVNSLHVLVLFIRRESPIETNKQKPTEEKYKNLSLMNVPIGKKRFETKSKGSPKNKSAKTMIKFFFRLSNNQIIIAT